MMNIKGDRMEGKDSSEDLKETPLPVGTSYEPKGPPLRGAYCIAGVHTVDNPRGWVRILNRGGSDPLAAKETYKQAVSRALQRVVGGTVVPDGLDVYTVEKPENPLPQTIDIPEFGERFDRVWEKRGEQ